MSLYAMTGVYSDNGADVLGQQRDHALTSSLASPTATGSAAAEISIAIQPGRVYPAYQASSAGLGFSQSFNASAILASRQQYQLQVIAATFSSVTVFTTVCAVYWFYMMRRNFRRDLILLLIIGDVWKSLWFLIFAVTTLAQGHIPTHASFCQASGYLLQTGIESCDVAIFLISLHMMLQIFPPRNTFLGHDGLYQARGWVWAAWFILPNISASLAFINDHSGYISQGGFCTLPIRPFWYRLALSWIPRYLIWIFVMAVALRIYFHVGFEFRVFANEKDQTSSVGIPAEMSTGNNTHPSIPTIAMGRTASSQSDGAGIEKQTHEDGASAPEDDVHIPPLDPQAPEPVRLFPFRMGRRQSVPNWTSPFGDNAGLDIADDLVGSGSRSMPSSRRGSKQLTPGKPADTSTLPGSLDLSVARISFTPGGPVTAQPSYDPLSSSLEPITEYKTYHAAPGRNTAQQAMHERRRAIQRQLRVLFIYPVVYLMLWVIPFVAHCLNYSNYFAQHPVFALSALNVFCQTFMGFADVCIFCWRERPWRHIPGSDGSFLGSFLFWRFSSVPSTSTYPNPARRDSIPLSSARATAGLGTSSRASSHASFLASIKHWSLSAVSSVNPNRHPSSSSAGHTAASTAAAAAAAAAAAGGAEDNPSQRGSDASAATAPSHPRRPIVTIPQLAHRRAFSGGHSDRRVREAELAHERLALERADWALQHQRNLERNLRERGMPGGGRGGGDAGDRSASAISSSLGTVGEKREEGPAPRGRKEWWDRQMSLEGDY